jgi:hypothetical protein
VIRLFRVFIPASVVALLLSEIILILGCYVLAIFFLGLDPAFYLFDQGNYWKLLVVTSTTILGLYFQDLYGDLRITANVLLVQQVCLAVGLSLLISAFIGYLDPAALLGRYLMMYGSLGVVVLLPLWRIFFWRYVIAGLRSERVLLMGNSSILGEVITVLLGRPEFGYKLVGYLCEDHPCDFPIPCLGTVADVRAVCEQHRPMRIVVGMAERRNRLPVQDLLEIRFGGVFVEDAADTYEMALHRVCSSKIQPSQLIFSSMLGPSRNAITLQVFYSFFISFIGLIVAAPFLLLTALAVLKGSHALPSAQSGVEWSRLHCLQVSVYVRRCRSSYGSRLGFEG